MFWLRGTYNICLSHKMWKCCIKEIFWSVEICLRQFKCLAFIYNTSFISLVSKSTFHNNGMSKVFNMMLSCELTRRCFRVIISNQNKNKIMFWCFNWRNVFRTRLKSGLSISHEIVKRKTYYVRIIHWSKPNSW